MSRETYEEYLKRAGVEVDPARVTAFARHLHDCPTCRVGQYAYLRCPQGLDLARSATRPIDKSQLRG